MAAEPVVHSYFTYPTPAGPLTLGAVADALTAVAPGAVTMPGQRRATAVTNAAANQILEYFAGRRTVFDVPWNLLEGTVFQRRVWHAADGIPYGQTRTAAEIAVLLNEPQGFRAVGAALRKNPLAIILPAHRVVGARGTIDGADPLSALFRFCLETEARFA